MDTQVQELAQQYPVPGDNPDVQNDARLSLDDNTRLSLERHLEREISLADNYYSAEIEPMVQEAYQQYNADPEYYAHLFPELSKYSSFVSRDVHDTIASIMPSLMKTFFSSSEVITVLGRDGTQEDTRRAQIMQELINYQLENGGYQAFETWFKDSLITNLAVLKTEWKREYGPVTQQQVVSPNLLPQYQSLPDFKILQQNPDSTLVISYTATSIVDNGPSFQNVPLSQFRYSPNATTLSDATFVAHRKVVPYSYFIQHQQDYDYLPPLEEFETYTPTPIESYQNPHVDEYQQNENAPVVVYECYLTPLTSLDLNFPTIITYTNGRIIRAERNTYRIPPFFVISPESDSARIHPRTGFMSLVGPIQHLKTAILRQMLINLSSSNQGRFAVDTTNLVDPKDLTDDKRFIRIRGSLADAIAPLPTPQLQPWTFNLLEYLESQKERRTGVTAYNQGIDSNSLNKMLDINTPVPLFDGSIKLLRDIQDGDVLISSQGTPTTVTKAHPIQKPIHAYEIRFKNQDTIIAGGEHLWTVRSNNNKKYKVMDTDTLYNLSLNSTCNYYVPNIAPVLYDSNQELPVDPYLLGLYLGDGSVDHCQITTMDEEVYEAFENYAKENDGCLKPDIHKNSGKATTYTICSTPLSRILKGLGIMTREEDRTLVKGKKYIPDVYFTTSLENRLALLRGLMDTDGTIDRANCVRFATTTLKDDFLRLLDTLGLKYSVRVHNSHWSKNDCYIITFRPRENPFTVLHKRERFRVNDRYNDINRIESITLLENPHDYDMRCLTVDSEDGLFAVGTHYTLTHNTATGINIISQMANQRLELIARNFAQTGVTDLFRHLIYCNQTFMNQETVIRLVNTPLTVYPEDLQGNFDLQVNAAMGSSNKEQTLSALQLIAQYQEKLATVNLAGPEQFRNLFRKLCESLGFKNADDFVFSKEEYLQYQQVIQQQQKQQAQLQYQSQPRVSVNYQDLPWQAQQALIQSFGIDAPDNWFTEKAEQDAAKSLLENTTKKV